MRLSTQAYDLMSSDSPTVKKYHTVSLLDLAIKASSEPPPPVNDSFIWWHSLLEGGPCGCSLSTHTCTVWT